jgi:predicted glycogen debranching enzyme
MDAKVGDWVVTPRIGKAVEINALWYSALGTMALFAEKLQMPTEPFKAMVTATKSGFQRFINPGSGGLFDVLDSPAATMRQSGPTNSLPSAYRLTHCLRTPNKR